MKKLLLLLLLPILTFAQDSWINIQFDFDGYADEVTWNLYNSSGDTIASGGDYENGQQDAFHQISLDSGDYTFELLDAWGDGMGWPPDNLGWCLISNDCQEELFYASGNYGFGLIESLTIAPCAPPVPPVIGCMDENALNYDETAEYNDEFMCEYPACEGWGEPYVTQECVNGSALLYYHWEASDNPNCNVIQITYGSDNATNAYNFDVDIDGGLWGVWAGNGTMPPNWEEEFYFIATFADSTISDTIFHTPYPCTQGCTDEESDNYNPWATIDDGSCGNQACSEGYVPLTIEVTLDNWPGETGWSFVSGDGSMEVPSGDYSYQDVGQTFTYNVCAMEGGFEFIITDTYGDGLGGSATGGTLDGDVVIKGCDGEIITQLSNGDWTDGSTDVGVGFGSVAYSTWQESTICAGPEEILGCTDANYQEFSIEANVDDGSCVTDHILGCTNENAFNYDENATQMEIYEVCDYILTIEDDAGDGWGNSFLGVVQGGNQWTFTMGPGEYEQSFPIWLETDKLVTFYYFAVGSVQTPPEEVAFQTLHNSFTLTNANGVVLLEEGTNPFADNGQGALQPFEAPLFTNYKALPFCGTLCIPTVLGCLDSEALNYNEEANTDDGTCIAVIEGCTNELAFNYNAGANTDNGSCIPVVVGCMNELAWNYNEGANIDDGSCLYFGCTDEEAINFNYIANVDNGSCLYPGCTDSAALNYNEYANTDDGSCIPVIYGCTDETAFNYNPDANTDNDSCVPVIEGCTNIFAFNYDVFANVDDDSCILTVYGCTDETALNYNPDANIDNDSCIEIIEGCTDSTALNYDENANVEDFSCIAVVNGCTDSSALNYDEDANVDNGSCIEVVEGCTDSTATNYDENANVDDFSCIPYIYGCTDETALNYNELANTDNGTCIAIIEGCTNPIALNYNESANIDDFSCILPIYGCTDNSSLNYDENANVDNGTCIEIVEGCTDSAAINYNELANVDDFSCIDYIYGCTDETALNYNELANTDNGTCIEVVEGCTDPTALNYNELANVDDFSCILPIYGCTDPEAFNYNELANIDNDSCIPVIYGCTDETAFNYDSEANTEDFSCIEVIYGCTDPTALNFNPEANTDNGSCIEVVEGCTDMSAINYSFFANVDDGGCLYDAGCSGGVGEPYFLPNECFEWVISIDTECCSGEWDSYCVDLYNYCDLGWPIDLEEMSGELLIYPNPVTDILNMSKEIDLKLYDMVGNLIISAEKSTQINMTNLPSGIYNLNIIHNNKNINNRIIKH